MTLLIRPLRKPEIKAVVSIYSKVIHPSYIAYGELNDGSAKNSKEFSNKAIKNFKKYVSGFLGKKDKAVYVAFIEKDMVGFICVEIKKAKAGHKECGIMDMGVAKPFRRLGIAKKLMQKVYSFGEKSKVKYFFLNSGYHNHGAHAFFKKEGFVPLNIVFIKNRFR